MSELLAFDKSTIICSLHSNGKSHSSYEPFVNIAIFFEMNRARNVDMLQLMVESFALCFICKVNNGVQHKKPMTSLHLVLLLVHTDVLFAIGTVTPSSIRFHYHKNTNKNRLLYMDRRRFM